MRAAVLAQEVGLVGLGAMGTALSANLLRSGVAVTGFDTDPARLEALAAAGGTRAASAAAVAGAVDVLLLSLPSQAAFEAVVAEVAAGARDGLVVVETSTLALQAKEAARELLATAGVTLLDCPLSGTSDQAAVRDVVVFASGPPEAVQRCVPVFEAFARAHHDLGAFGNGTRMKLVANHLVAVHNVAAAEALALADAAGLDLGQTLRAVADGAGSSRMFEVRGPRMVAGDFAPGVRTSVFQKDLALISAFAEEHGVQTPLLAFSTWLYAASAEAGHAEQDTAAVYEVLRALAAATPRS